VNTLASSAVDTRSSATSPIPIWLLALITFSGTLAMHIFVPALSLAANDLHATVAELQLTVSCYIFGLALGQLLYGPLADRYGRRPVLMAGLVLYVLAGLAAWLSPNVHALLVARLFQALGGCAGLVIARTIVRDTSSSADTARRLATMNLMVTVGPGLAPVIGGVLAATFGWRSILAALCLLGGIILLLTWKMVPETGTPNLEASAKSLRRDYLSLLRSNTFICYAIGGGCATTSMYAFTASAPFIIVNELHQPTTAVGLCLGLLILGYWIGSVLATQLIGRFELKKLMITANLLSIAAAIAFFGLAVSGQLSVPTMMLAIIVYTIGAGIASPNALTLAVSVNPKVTGSASGLYGSTQMAVGAVCSGLAGFGSDPGLAAASVLIGASLLAQGCFWFAGSGPDDDDPVSVAGQVAQA
jgi:DHA1 family bicyclomycin/chloramphenicol resistance-like MFS transporter